ncbi:hypothetical protein E2C01_041396 [Portunus trituberculatus]|uniref:Uncharacterized protein n=1 Tax=Portunus trituberculatus TaxID=210409 RepID=A0A5B7FMH7_PORTR|nr:hypothetical protein [Portunus trituberculatus]
MVMTHQRTGWVEEVEVNVAEDVLHLWRGVEGLFLSLSSTLLTQHKKMLQGFKKGVAHTLCCTPSKANKLSSSSYFDIIANSVTLLEWVFFSYTFWYHRCYYK